MPRLLNALVSLLIVIAASATLWAGLGRPVDMVDVPGGRLACLSYTPYDGSSSPLDGKDFKASTQGIRADLEAVQKVTNCIRTYSALDPASKVVPIAAELGLTVWQGLWIGAREEENDAEINAAAALAKAYPGTIQRFVVGNEVLLRRELLGEELAVLLKRVKALAPGIPVTYADVPEFWRRNPVLGDAADVVTIHILPYWDDPLPMTMDEVQAHARALVKEMQTLYPNHPVAIGEIGWPSAGRTRGGVIPNLVNEARFVREFVAQADAIGVDYNIVEAIDQDWKIWPEGTVGGHWGILDNQRREKFPLIGPVSEWPRWPLAAVLSSLGAVAAVVLGGLGIFGRAPVTFRHWLSLAGLGQAMGIITVLGVQFIVDTSFGWPMWVLNSTMLGFGLLCVLTLGPISVGGTQPLRVASIVAVAAWLRRPKRMHWNAEIGLGLVFAVPLLWTGQLAILHAFDGRHRDFPLAILVPIACVQALRWWLNRKGQDADTHLLGGQREEAWLTIIFLICGALAWNGPNNVEAMAWMATLVLFALPGLGEVRVELRRLFRAGGTQQRHQQPGGR